MRKLLTMLAFGAVVSASQAALIFDNFNATGGTHAFAFTGSTPRYTIADDISTLDPGTNMDWAVQNIHLYPLFAVARSYVDVRMRVRVYDTYTSNGSPEVFSNQVSDVTWLLGNLTTTAAGQAFDVTLDYALANLVFMLQSGQAMGVRVDYTEGTVQTNDITNLLSNDALAPAVGTSSDGWFRDTDNDGLIEPGDKRTFAAAMDNMVLQMNANAVPEPATLAVLGLGAAALLRRRRK